MAAITTPNIEATLLTEEQQVQCDADDLMKALEEANRKCEDLAKKQWDAQVMREKHEVDRHEADVKVRGKLLTNAVVAEVRLVAEKLQVEREASQLPRKVKMRLEVSDSFFLFTA